jgi:sec-independent protein translocase protein TatA
MGTGELIVVLVVIVLVFGAAKIPQLGDALGKGIRNFKKARVEDDAIDVTPRSPQQLPNAGAAAKPTAPNPAAGTKKA